MSLLPQISQWLPISFRRQFNSLLWLMCDQAPACCLSPLWPFILFLPLHLSFAGLRRVWHAAHFAAIGPFPSLFLWDAFATDLHVVGYFFSSFMSPPKVPWPPNLKSPVSLPHPVPLLCFVVIIAQYFSPSKLPSACWTMSHVPSRSPTRPRGRVFWKQLSLSLASSLPGFSLDFTLF